jgi:hypothetical protein
VLPITACCSETLSAKVHPDEQAPHQSNQGIRLKSMAATYAYAVDRALPGMARALGFGKFRAATGYGGLSGLCEAKARRRRVLVMGAARVTAFHAIVLWTFRLAHAADIGLFACARKPTGARRCGVRASLWVGSADILAESRKTASPAMLAEPVEQEKGHRTLPSSGPFMGTSVQSPSRRWRNGTIGINLGCGVDDAQWCGGILAEDQIFHPRR